MWSMTFVYLQQDSDIINDTSTALLLGYNYFLSGAGAINLFQLNQLSVFGSKKCWSCTFSTSCFTRLVLPNTPQARRMPSATQAWATRARAMASACIRAGFVPNTASHGCHGFSNWLQYYASVGDQWECYDTFQRNQLTPFSLGLCGQPYCLSVGVVISLVAMGLVLWVWSVTTC